MNNPVTILNQMIHDPGILAGVDVDHAYGDQCWDLVELYAERLGVPKNPWAITLGPNQAAMEAWTVFDTHMQEYFVKIPVGQQQAGDIAVYQGHGVYTAGHIAIWVTPTTVFEQNADPDGAKAHVFARSNTFLLGSLRLKEANMPTAQEVSTQFAQFQGTPPTADQIKYYTSHDWGTLNGDLLQEVYNELQALKKGTTKDQVLSYISSHLN